MSVFTEAELDYLQSKRIGRVATSNAKGDLHVVPLRFKYNAQLDVIDLEWPQGSTHVISQAKEQTHTIESLNANLRHYLKRLARRTRCFSKSFKALARSVKLFAWYYNRRQRVILANNLSRYRRSCLSLYF
jgi:uncharacterized protein with WD repeat